MWYYLRQAQCQASQLLGMYSVMHTEYRVIYSKPQRQSLQPLRVTTRLRVPETACTSTNLVQQAPCTLTTCTSHYNSSHVICACMKVPVLSSVIMR
jgi:hypothetical protein